MDDPRRCTAKISDGTRRCKKTPMLGQRVCRSHGGASPQARRSARQRLMELAEPAVEALRVALESDDIRAIIRAAVVVLDRTGHHPRQHVEVEDVTDHLWLQWATTAELKRVEKIIRAAEARRAAGDDRLAR